MMTGGGRGYLHFRKPPFVAVPIKIEKWVPTHSVVIRMILFDLSGGCFGSSGQSNHLFSAGRSCSVLLNLVVVRTHVEEFIGGCTSPLPRKHWTILGRYPMFLRASKTRWYEENPCHDSINAEAWPSANMSGWARHTPHPKFRDACDTPRRGKRTRSRCAPF